MMKNEILVEELKEIQLNILDEVATFCEKSNLRYCLGYGTLIGAIRHKGYIPWDDDIDIIMPRSDYERFISCFNKNSNYIKVIDNTNNSKYELPFAKIYDTRTEMVEEMYKPNCQYGVYIDLFPIDGYKKRIYPRIVTILSKFLNTKKAIVDRRRSLIKTIIITVGKIILLPFSVGTIINGMNCLARKYDYDKSEFVNSMFSPYCLREMCPKSWIDITTFTEFEGKQFRIPEKYDKYLRNIYGDYMKYPPLEKQVSHHTFRAWWK